METTNQLQGNQNKKKKIKEVYGICLKYCRGNEKNDERNTKF